MKQTRLVIGLIATVLSPHGSLAMDEPDAAELIFVNYSRTDLYYLYFEWFYLGTAVARGKR